MDEQNLHDKLTELADSQDDRSAQPLPEVLAAGRHRLLRRRLTVAGSSAVAAVLVGGVAVGVTGAVGGDRAPVAGRTAEATPGQSAAAPGTKPGTDGIQVNLGPMSAAETAAMVTPCVKNPNGVPNPSGVAGAVTHAVKYRGWGNYPVQFSVAVQDRRTGLVTACAGQPTKRQRTGQVVSGFTSQVIGGPLAATRPWGYSVPAPDARTPALDLPLEGLRSSVDLDDKPDHLSRESWFVLTGQVAEIRQRYVINGRPGPWYVAKAVDRLAYVASQNQSTLRRGDKIRLETQALDAQGKLLPAPAELVIGGGVIGGGGVTNEQGTTQIRNYTLVQQPGSPHWTAELQP